MAIQCLTWILYFWDQLVGQFPVNTSIVRPLPDDVIAEILKRLPVDCVLNCRRVCKRWRELTLTSHFAELQLNSVGSPVVFMQRVDYHRMDDHEFDFFIFHPRSEQEKMVTRVQVSSECTMIQYRPLVIDSCNGLFLFRSVKYPSMLFVYNPITQEEITLRTPHSIGYMCGIFFQPLTREYKLLYAQCQRKGFRYLMCTLGNNIWRHLSYFAYRPANSSTAITVNGALHWIIRNDIKSLPPCTDAIMVFNINREEFHVMRHPGNECRSRQSYETMYLLEMKQHLSLCHVDLYRKCIDIWVLENYATCTWVRTFKVSLDWDVKRYPFRHACCIPDYCDYRITPIMVCNSELLLSWDLRGIFWYHLELNTIKKLQSTVLKKNNIESTYTDCRFTTYTKTLITLTNVATSV